MLLLLLGFIAPAVLFAILGLIACIRRAPYAQIDEVKVTQSQSTVATSESFQRTRAEINRRRADPVDPPNSRPPLSPDLHDCQQSYSHGYQNHYFETFTLPPSYSETIALDQMGAATSPTEGKKDARSENSSTPHSKHLPSRQPRILITAASPNLRDNYY
ncbi:unnamed protein product, partial [Mesorhabditis belari]|uniref:Uncharacterized protein n=1 Tax=Mesorhabditis belari TaxID=2138241 RepID=A0AAF3ENR0_9BILA